MAFNLFEVVKYEGNRDSFAWMFENPNVKRNTSVIVGANQIAFWVSNGQLIKSMGPGKHKLDGNYVQGFSWLVSQFHGGDVPSSGEIWFVSTGMRNLQWGTPNRISINLNYFDAFKTTAMVAANGNIQLKLEPSFDDEGGSDVEKFWDFIQELREQYGDNRSVSVAGLQRFVLDSMLTQIQGGLAQALKQVNYGDHYAQLPQLSAHLAATVIVPELEGYGLQVKKFQVRTLEGDEKSIAQFAAWWKRLTDSDIAKYEALRHAEAERYGIEQVGFGTAASRQAQGFTFQEERQFDVLDSGASNAGVGGDFLSAGVGMAMGSQMGNVMGGMFVQSAADAEASREHQPDIPPPATTGIFVANNLADNTAPGTSDSPASETKFCTECGQKIATTAKFCPNCGAAQ